MRNCTLSHVRPAKTKAQLFKASLTRSLWSNVNCSSNLFVLRFYGPVNPMGPCRARSFYLTTRLLGRLSPLSV